MVETFEADLRTEYTRIQSLYECVGKTIEHTIKNVRCEPWVGIRFSDHSYYFAQAKLGHLNIVIDLDENAPLNEAIALRLGIIDEYEAERFHLARLCNRGVLKPEEAGRALIRSLGRLELSVDQRGR